MPSRRGGKSLLFSGRRSGMSKPFIEEWLQLMYFPTELQLREHAWRVEVQHRLFLACWLEYHDTRNMES